MAKINGLDKMSYAELAEMEAQIDRLKSEKQGAERSGAPPASGRYRQGARFRYS